VNKNTDSWILFDQCTSRTCVIEMYVSKQNASDIRDCDTPVPKLTTQYMKRGRRARVQECNFLLAIEQAARDVPAATLVFEIDSHNRIHTMV
jgi:hypothetical protein